MSLAERCDAIVRMIDDVLDGMDDVRHPERADRRAQIIAPPPRT